MRAAIDFPSLSHSVITVGQMLMLFLLTKPVFTSASLLSYEQCQSAINKTCNVCSESVCSAGVQVR